MKIDYETRMIKIDPEEIIRRAEGLSTLTEDDVDEVIRQYRPIGQNDLQS